jgi:hypothetical protein
MSLWGTLALVATGALSDTVIIRQYPRGLRTCVGFLFGINAEPGPGTRVVTRLANVRRFQEVE